MQNVNSKNISKALFINSSKEWKSVYLKEICTFKKGKKISKSDLSPEGYDCIHYGQLYTIYDKIIRKTYSKTNISKDKLIFSEKYDILIAATGETPVDISKSHCVFRDNIAIGSDIIIIESTINNVFLNFYLNYMQNKIASLAQGVSVYHLNINDLKNITITIPSREKQDIITDFLLLIEKKIGLLKKKTVIYERIKRYFLLNLFPKKNELKAKLNFNNSKWDFIQLKDYGIAHSGIIGKTLKDFGEGKRYLQYKAILDGEYVDTSYVSLVNITDDEQQYSIKYNDIIFNISSEIAGEVALASLVPAGMGECYLNSFCYAYSVNRQEELNQLFLVYYFRSPIMRHKLKALAQGSTRYNLSKKKVLNMHILIPSVTSQKKIIKLLENIDKQIDYNHLVISKIIKYQQMIMARIFYK